MKNKHKFSKALCILLIMVLMFTGNMSVFAMQAIGGTAHASYEINHGNDTHFTNDDTCVGLSQCSNADISEIDNTVWIPVLDPVIEDTLILDSMFTPDLVQTFENTRANDKITAPVLEQTFEESIAIDSVYAPVLDYTYNDAFNVEVMVQGLVTIQYRGNGHTSGTVPASHTLLTPGSTTLRLPGTMARAGHMFVGWRDSAGNVFQAGATISWNIAVSGTLILDAHWIPSIVTIQYRGNGHTSGTVPASHTLLTPGSTTLRLPGTMARAGYMFAGWRDSVGNIVPPGATIQFNAAIAGTLTLDAHWVDWIWWQRPGEHNSNLAGFWPGTINVHTHTIGTVSDTFVFHYRMLRAQQAWSGALGVPITGVTQAVNAQIRAFGGRLEYIYEFHGAWDPRWAGLASPPTVQLEQSINIDNLTRHIFRHSGQGRIYVIERQNANEVLTVTKHEVGHALGYWGHSPHNHDVMWYRLTIPPNTALGQNEVRHLRQIYDYFR